MSDATASISIAQKEKAIIEPSGLRQILPNFILAARRMYFLFRYGWFERSLRLPKSHGGMAANRLVTDIGTFQFPDYDRVMSDWIRQHGTWEPEEQGYLKDILRPGDVAVNIGANVGCLVGVMSKVVGRKGIVIAIEPEPRNFELLMYNIRFNRWRNAVCVNTAISDTSGMTALNVSPDNCGDHRTSFSPFATHSIPVPCRLLDEVVPRWITPKVIVVDTQGSDHRTLMKGARTLRSVEVVLTEFWPKGIIEAGDDPADVFEWYQSWGWLMTDASSGVRLDSLRFSDALAVMLSRKEFTTIILHRREINPLGDFSTADSF